MVNWKKVAIDSVNKSPQEKIREGIFASLIIIFIIGFTCLLEYTYSQFAQTEKISYLFVCTFLRMFSDHYILVAISIFFGLFIYRFINAPRPTKESKRYSVIILFIYIIFCLIFLLGRPIRMNTMYTINKSPVSTTGHALFYQLKDIITNDEIIFTSEPCELDYKVETFYSGKRGKKIESKAYDYLCLKNQNDVIPIPSKYASKIQTILEKSGGICDVTCYKNSHIIKAINGVNLSDLK